MQEKIGGGKQDSQIGRKEEKIIMFTYFLHITGMLFLYMCFTIEIINKTEKKTYRQSAGMEHRRNDRWIVFLPLRISSSLYWIFQAFFLLFRNFKINQCFLAFAIVLNAIQDVFTPAFDTACIIGVKFVQMSWNNHDTWFQDT